MSLSLSGRKLYRVNVHVDCHQPEKTPADVRARDLIKFLVLAKPEDKVSSLKKDVVEELKSFPRSEGFVVEGFQTEREFDMHEDQTLYHVVDDDSIVNVIGHKGPAENAKAKAKESKPKAAKAAKPIKETSSSTTSVSEDKTTVATTPTTSAKKEENKKKDVAVTEAKDKGGKQDDVKDSTKATVSKNKIKKAAKVVARKEEGEQAKEAVKEGEQVKEAVRKVVNSGIKRKGDKDAKKEG
ncbi:hypothetical protein BGZ96_001529, partial [Linnemannia gamsii]